MRIAFCVATMLNIIKYFDFYIFLFLANLLQTKLASHSDKVSNEKPRSLLSLMTLDEKLSLLHGITGTYVGNLPGVKRLGIPALNLQDGMLFLAF